MKIYYDHVNPEDFDVSHLKAFREKMSTCPWTSLALSRETEDLNALESVAERFRGTFDDVLILGTGGSSLGGQTICALASTPKPHLHFLDNIDFGTFETLFQTIDVRKTGVIVISKSGSTAETLMQCLTCLPVWEKVVGRENLKDHFLLITEPTPNPLRQLGARYGFEMLNHPTDVGGRFSCLSLVALLPAMIVGVDVRALREGARGVLDDVMIHDAPAPFVGAMTAYELGKKHHIFQDVIMPYVDVLGPFGLWFRQLWAESLGKKGVGRTPIRAMGTVDQHSQLQLYLDGPRDKYFTVITTDSHPSGPAITDSGIDYLDGRTMGDLLRAEQEATIETLRRKGCPLRVIHVEHVTPFVLGQLLMHYMIETILTASLMGIDAFNQPAVEEGKIIARDLMGKMV